MLDKINLLHLKKEIILSGLTDEELDYLAKHVQQESFSHNEEIIRENDPGTDIYFIVDGEVVVMKKDEKESGEHELRRLHKGDLFGEMAIIDNQPRSATVRTVIPTQVLRLPLDKLDIQQPIASSIYDKVLGQLAQTSIGNIRATNQDYVKSLQEHIRYLDIQNQFGTFFVCVIALYAIQTLLDLVLPLESGRYSLKWLSWVRLLLLLIPTLFLARYLHFSLKNFGLTREHAKKALLETALILGAAFVVSSIYAYYVNLFPQFKVSFVTTVASWFSWKALALLFYILCVEFVIRGVIQTSLQRFLRDNRGFIAVFLTANFLWLLNLYMGLYEAGIRFGMDMFLGCVYVRQQTLIGVVILHFVITAFTQIYY